MTRLPVESCLVPPPQAGCCSLPLGGDQMLQAWEGGQHGCRARRLGRGAVDVVPVHLEWSQLAVLVAGQSLLGQGWLGRSP